MIRARFFTKSKDDPRPVSWPVKHPFWITGETDEHAVIIAYADDEDEIKRLWPEAEDIESVEAFDYIFTGQFPKPDWMK